MKSILVILLTVIVFNTQANFKTDSTIVELKRHELGINVAAYLGLYNSNVSPIVIQSLVYRKNISPKNSLYFSLSMRYSHKRKNSIYGTPPDTLILFTETENYSAPRFTTNYERNWRKKHLTYYLGIGLYIEWGQNNYRLDKDYLEAIPGYSYTVNDVTILNYRYLDGYQHAYSYTNVFVAGINAVAGIKIPISKHFMIAANTALGYDISKNKGYRISIGTDSKEHFNYTNTGSDYPGLISELVISYCFGH